MGKDATLSLRDDAGQPPRPRGPMLAQVLHAAHPLEPPRCHALDTVDEVTLGRGRNGPGSALVERALRIDLDDPAVSVEHARLRRTAGGFEIEDLGSKNGTLLDGRRVAGATVGPDELLELGNCFFFVGDGLAAPESAHVALRTLDARLAREFEHFRRVARSKVAMLLVGETGTGKEMLARAAHAASGREGPFVAVNCGAIPQTLVESELFGARKGAYSGATADRPGIVSSAHRGTLLLDEVAELPGSSQAALLRVIQEGEVVALGSTKPVRVDVRILAATHQDLPARVAAGTFREDLYARLRGHVLTLPPLRARRVDLGLLVAELMPRVAGQRAGRIRLQRAAARALLLHHWPHNIRELERVLGRAVALLEDEDEIRVEHLAGELQLLETPVASAPILDERSHLVELLRRSSGNISAVARELETSRTHVQRLLTRHGIDLKEFRDP